MNGGKIMANITKYVKMLMRKGLKTELSTLDEAEIGLATDTKEVFVGANGGNVQLAKQSDVKDNQDKVRILSESLISKSHGISITDTLGTNVHELQYTTNFPLLRQKGVKIARESILWDKVETTQGVYNFTPTGINYDTFIQRMVDNDIKPYMILMPSNTLYTTALNSSLDTDAKRTAFANFAGATAAHFKNKNIIWEIYNEPNGSWAWTPQTDGAYHYSELVKKTAPLIKQNDPTAFVVAPALFGPESFTNTGNIAYGLTWLEETFKNGILDYIDAVSVHPYRDVNPETVIADYKKIRTLIKTYSDRDIPIVCGEWGYSSTPNWDGTGSSAVVPDELTQAQYVSRMLLINNYQNIPVTIYYDWKNDGQSTSAVESNFGLMQYDQTTPKQAATAYQTLSQTLDGYYFTERIDTGSHDDYVFKYINADSEVAYVYWTVGSDRNFTLITEGAVSGTIVSMLGTSTTLASTTNPTLSLGKSPAYLLIDGKQTVTIATPQRLRDAVEQAQDFLKEWTNDSFVEDNSKNITLADLDTLVKRGEYRIVDSANSFWGGVLVFGRDVGISEVSAEVGQIRFNSLTQVWDFRSCTVSGGVRTWKAWKTIFTKKEFDYTTQLDNTDLNTVKTNGSKRVVNTNTNTPYSNFFGAINVIGAVETGGGAGEFAQLAVGYIGNRLLVRSATVSGGTPSFTAWEEFAKLSTVQSYTWTTPSSLLNGATVNSGESFQHTKISTGVVYLQGAVNSPSTGTGLNVKVYTLPTGSRPTKTRYIKNDVGKFRIDVNGDITILETTQTFFAIIDNFLGV